MRFWRWWWWWGAVGGSLLTNHHTLEITCGASRTQVSKSFRTPCISKCDRQEKTDLGLFSWLLLVGLRLDLGLRGCAELPAAWLQAPSQQSPLRGPYSSAKPNAWTCFSQLLPDVFGLWGEQQHLCFAAAGALPLRLRVRTAQVCLTPRPSLL